jgi:class 3 adenylate cyclase
VGNTVNIAARLEQLGKEPGIGERASDGGTIFIAETTFHHLDPSWHMKEVGEFLLRGKKERVMVYQVLGRMVKTPTDE